MLNHRVEIFVPGTKGLNGALDNAEHESYVKQTLATLAKLFGGATAETCQGAYVSDSGELVIEPITRVWAMAENITPETKLLILQYCATVKQDLAQESVAYMLDGSMDFA